MTSVLVTGGTGSFGQAYISHLLTLKTFDRIICFSRDELKQHEMRTKGGFTDSRLRFFIGDVRDRERLERAMHGVDTVVHAAALKQVDACEFNPLEAVKTNVQGTANVIDAAIDAKVTRVLGLGTDKAVDPTNLYGATKLVAEKLLVDANAYNGPLFAATRYGNVISSRGSVLPVFQAQQKAGVPLTVTDPDMTRFVLTISRGVGFIGECLGRMKGGEVFAPKLPAATVRTIAHSVDLGNRAQPAWIVTGLRPGEKRHELLVSDHEASRTLDCGWCYLIRPVQNHRGHLWDGQPVPAGFRYSSHTATQLDVEAFRELAGLAARVKLNA
jgi:UDP-N-acetylglucosamine 4,6-dehydratase